MGGSEPATSKLADAVSRMVLRVDLAEGHEGGQQQQQQQAAAVKKKHHQGPLTPQELKELSFFCTASSAAVGGEPGFCSVEADQLMALTDLLDRHVNLAVSVNLVNSAVKVYQSVESSSPSQAVAAMDKWFKTGKGGAKLAALRGGLEAAAIIVFIANQEGVDHRAVNEDAIESSITLMRLHLAKHLVPALNQADHFLSPSKDTSPNKKRRRNSKSAAAASTGSSIPANNLKKVYEHIIGTIQLQHTLMERLQSLVKSLPLDDQQVLLLTNGALPALEIDCNATSKESVKLLQFSVIAIVTAAFRKYPRQRETILEDLFPLMPYLPTGKRSLRAFPVRYSSAAASDNLKNLNAKLVGPLLSNGDSPHCIQMLSALVLSLVHACVVRPTFEVATTEEEPQTTQSGLRSSQAVADSFVAQLLKSCHGKNSEYRRMLGNTVEDFLLVLLIPEYPAAELLVASLQRRLNQDLTMSNPVFNMEAPLAHLEVTYLNTAFDTMGKICAVQARILAVARGKPIGINDSNDVPMSDADEMVVKCHCESRHDDVFMISCDKCKAFHHGSCIGLPNRESVPEEWMCDACYLGQIIDREQRKISSDHEVEYLDESYAMRHSFQAVTAHRLGVEMDDSVHFHLARWIDELERKGTTVAGPRKIVASLLEHWDTPGPSAEPLTEEGSVRVILHLMAKTSPLFLSFRKQIGFLLKIMSEDSRHALRKLSLKVIEKTVEGDQSLMLRPVLTNAVSKRLSDESISVREAAVSLVGSYVVKSPSASAIQNYQAALIPCLTDAGVSVRKRAVKIFGAILSKNPRYKGRSMVCNILLQRSADPKEEDAVRDQVDELFCTIWLRDGEKDLSPAKRSHDRMKESSSDQAISLPGVVTPTTPIVPMMPSQRKWPRSRSDVAAEHMMEVVSAGKTGAHLESLLKKLLCGGVSSETDRKQAAREKRQELGLNQCTQLVNSLCELLMVVDEQRESRPQVGRDLAATLSAIAVFANVSPYPVLKHLDQVLPFLKADNGVSGEDEANIIFASCDILYRLQSTFDHKTLARLGGSDVCKDLTKIAYKFGPAALGSAIRAFSALAHHADVGDLTCFSEKLLALAKTFYGYLIKKNAIDDFSSSPEKMRNSVYRALTILGLICENYEGDIDSSVWGEEVESDESPLLPCVELSWGNFTLACYRLFSKYLEKADSSTKCKALAALKGIFVAQPQVLVELDHVGLFERVMSDDAGVPLQLEALECWRNILTAEERRVDSGQADAKMDANGNITVSKKISGDQNGEATLFGGVLTSHADRLYKLSHSTNPLIRQSTLELLGLLMRQGLINPNECVPILFSLQGDVGNKSIRSLALKLLMTEGEKRPDTLRRRICAGVKQAYDFQRAVSPLKAQTSAVVSENGKFVSIFNDVFKEIIVKNKKRKDLYKSLISLFELENIDDYTERSTKTKPVSKDLSLLSFAAQILAHLPYNTASDPLYIIHCLSTIITLQGLQTLDRFAAFLRPFGLASDDELDDSNEGEDALERAAQSKFPSRTQEARPLSSKEFDMVGYASLCRDAAALSLLLRLKAFLCSNYNLSATRCIEYDPNVKEKLCEKGISKPSFSQPFTGGVDYSADKDALIRQYADFRKMMREDGSGPGNRSDDETSARKRDRSSSEDAESN